MSAASRKYCSIAIPATAEYLSFVEDLRSAQEDKLDNLPDNLKDSEKADNFSEALDFLEELLDDVITARDALDGIAYSTGIDTSKLEQPMSITPEDDGPRNNRFQILLSSNLLILLKLRSLQNGVSCNELICQALKDELLRDPNEQK